MVGQVFRTIADRFCANLLLFMFREPHGRDASMLASDTEEPGSIVAPRDKIIQNN
jgi:hypothetical protein